jgi:hypothetical protein
MAEQDEREEVINLILDDDVSIALCRRGKLKLRDIETTSRALLRMDASKKGLEIRGSPACVADARHKIENLSGIKLDTRPTVWAELMRTRTSSDTATAAIANIQETCGCRVHVKRDSTQIQLFGPKERTHIAAQLIERLDSMCGELSVGTTASMSEEKLHTLARSCGVTLVVEKGHIKILGIKGAISEAAREILFWGEEGDDELESKEPQRSEVAHAAIEKVFAELKVATTIPLAPDIFTTASFAAGSDGSTEEGNSLTEGSHDTHDHDVQDTSTGPCSLCGAYQFCAQCGMRAEKMDQVYKGTCSKCLLSKFCVHCGWNFVRR